ncbi:hypothetical protein F5887DRAFT_1290333 [Amanita rubescens]|nr:hypothetical protein F5887DRAFT_1290333 [Amanita rubescens]
MLNVLRVRTLNWGPVQEEEARPSRVLAAKTRQQLYAVRKGMIRRPSASQSCVSAVSQDSTTQSLEAAPMSKSNVSSGPLLLDNHTRLHPVPSHQDLPLFITPETGPWHMFALLPSVPSSREFESIIASLSDALDF